MRTFGTRQALYFVIAALIVVASALLARVLWGDASLSAARDTGETRAELVAQTIRNTISQNEHFPLVLALDPDVQATLEAQDAASVDDLNRKLEIIEASGSPAALYVMKPDGYTLAASNWNLDDSFVGQYYGFRSYFTEAMAGSTGSYFGIGVTTGRAGYFVSRYVGEADDPVGIAVAKIEFDVLEETWARSSEDIMVTDRNGIIFLSGRPEWKYRSLQPVDDDAIDRIQETQQYAGTEISQLAIDTRSEDSSEVWIEGLPEDKSYLRQSVDLDELGWTVHQLTDLSSVSDARRDGTMIGATGSALLIAIFFYLAQRQRSYAMERRARAELEIRVAERTSELRETNQTLHLEIEERRRTEKELRTTQNELIQAGKLAALGQMSAAIAHEINQPLTALRTYIATTRMFLPLGDPQPVLDNLDKVDNLAVRMGRITSHLKTFARKEGMEPPEPISVARAVQRAIDLVEVQAHTSGVEIDRDLHEAWTMGNAVRLEQVVLNLLRNAMDAVAEVEFPYVRLTLAATAEAVSITVRDNGPGFAPDILDTLFDPFVTTKPSGSGLGLGLTISYEIIRDFGGTLSASNHPDGGALLEVRLKRCAMPVTAREVYADA